jgi:LysR family transcriptional regulator for metE and metH
LAEIGSATEAARALDLSQPSVSYHVKKLETSLGTSLFHRSAAGLVPTVEGTALVSRARTILAELGRLERDIQALAAGKGQTVRVSSACFTNYHWLPAVLRAFRRKHGEVHIRLDVDPSRRPFEAIDCGALDLALTTVPPEGSAFTLHELFDDEIVTVMHPDHPLASREYLKPQDFAEESIVVFDRTQSDLFNLALVPAGVHPRDVSDMPVTEAILELIRAGVAISAMASWVARPDLDEKRLSSVRIGREGLHRTWWAVRSSRRTASASVLAFLDILRETCAAARPHPEGLFGHPAKGPARTQR